MRMLMNVTIPHEAFNAAVKDGTVGAKPTAFWRPRSRSGLFHRAKASGEPCARGPADASKIPVLAEPWFLTFQADVEFRIAMTPDDLKRSGIDGMGREWT